jgi:hypothetical protein
MEENDLPAELESNAQKPKRRLPRLPKPPNFNLWGVIRFGVLAFFFFWCFVNYHKDVSVNVLESKYYFADSKKIQFDGMAVHYRINGTGEPILLLHGDASSLQTWANWTTKLADKYQVLGSRGQTRAVHIVRTRIEVFSKNSLPSSI